jgi:hypothetical protein
MLNTRVEHSILAHPTSTEPVIYTIFNLFIDCSGMSPADREHNISKEVTRYKESLKAVDLPNLVVHGFAI